jgi:peptidyl-prolyl cis-trans isomerase D
MSTIQFLREKAGVLVAIVIGIALLLFVVSDFFGSGGGQGRRARKYYEIGKIGKETVSYQDFEQKVQNLIEIYKLSGASNIDEATTESIREQTWQQMIRERILENQYKKLGIGVSAEEVDDLVLGNNPHQIVQQLFTDQNTGMFNKSFLVNFLKQTEIDETARRYWLFFEDEIVNERMNAKYNSLVSKGLFVTSKQLEFDSNLSASTVDFSYIVKNYSSVSDSLVTIGRNEIEDYYKKHKETFGRNALRDIEYVTFDIVPSEDDIKLAEDWINKTKDEFVQAADPVQFINLTADTRHSGFYVPANDVPSNLSDFVKKEDLKEVFGPYNEDGTFKLARLLDVANRPDSVHARHILLSPDQSSTMEQLRRSADSLIRLIKTGTRFEALAMSNSADQGSAQLGGDLGWFPEGRMVLPFNNACFSAKKGAIVTAETTFGIHIIEIIDQSRSTKKYNIGIIDRKIIPGSTTNQRIYSEASQFAGTNNTYEKFNQAVAEKGLNKRIANDITPRQKTLPGLNEARSLIVLPDKLKRVFPLLFGGIKECYVFVRIILVYFLMSYCLHRQSVCLLRGFSRPAKGNCRYRNHSPWYFESINYLVRHIGCSSKIADSQASGFRSYAYSLSYYQCINCCCHERQKIIIARGCLPKITPFHKPVEIGAEC